MLVAEPVYGIGYTASDYFQNQFSSIKNKLETFEDALFEGSKTSPHKTEKLDADLLPCGKRYAEKVKGWSSLNG